MLLLGEDDWYWCAISERR